MLAVVPQRTNRPLPKTGTGSEETGISKTTLLEHLRNAEAKLLTQYSQ